jgi:hypothetical protein
MDTKFGSRQFGVGMDDNSAITQTCETKAYLLMCRDSIVHNISFSEALANELQPVWHNHDLLLSRSYQYRLRQACRRRKLPSLQTNRWNECRNGSPQGLSRTDGGKNFGNVRSPQLASSRICPLRPPQDGYRHLGLVAEKVD